MDEVIRKKSGQEMPDPQHPYTRPFKLYSQNDSYV